MANKEIIEDVEVISTSNHKQKVKELIGTGLNRYNILANQQIDRIEKKNKEQNHKINILTNELDNDYLTKTEEGSVVSLEHSTEGLVEICELYGNTLVNYCTDGTKELVLNGDIDVEGTFVTTTEGVDGGLVDVLCEGNTLVNVIRKMRDTIQESMTVAQDFITITDHETAHRQNYFTLSSGDLNLIKPNTTYTIIANITKNTLKNEFTIINGYQSTGGDITSDTLTLSKNFIGTYIGKFTTLSDFTNRNRLGFSCGSGNRGDITLKNEFIILEGDYTNKPIPSEYFEGMKSVGEGLDKFEISSNKNSIKSIQQWEQGSIDGAGGYNTTSTTRIRSVDYLIVSTDYFIFIPSEKHRIAIRFYDSNKQFIMSKQYQGFINSNDKNFKYDIPSDAKYVRIIVAHKDIPISPSEVDMVNCTISFESNKKEISLNEALRGLPNGVKDRFVKIGGKWFIERNCGVGNSSNFMWSESGRQFEKHFCVFITNTLAINDSKFLSEKYPYIGDAYSKSLDMLYISNNSQPGNKIMTLTIPKVEMSTVDIVGARDYLAKNQFIFLFELAIPIYEPITDPTLTCYLDTTHISNNSIIPCNMKVKNSGYNVITKPNTLYTVALDTNKSGTIGMNLCGAKKTTTNNVALITTPSTLSDDSLRVYGKGVKGSKVRLLEGDKSNWIPSMFEGMKSCFEDKFDSVENGYKMEILNNNENLMPIKSVRVPNCPPNSFSNTPNSCWAYNIPCKPNTTYYVRYKRGSVKHKMCIFTDRQKQNFRTNLTHSTVHATVHGKTGHEIVGGYGIESGDYFTTQNWAKFLHFTTGNTILPSDKPSDNFTYILDDIIITEVKDLEYISHKHNKIQFLLNEPLRGINDVKDRFVFKDGKLMIERNCCKKTFDGTENWVLYPREVKVNFVNTISFSSEFITLGVNDISVIDLKCNLVPSISHYSTDIEGIFEKQSFRVSINKNKLNTLDVDGWKEYLSRNNMEVVYQAYVPTYEEIPFELQKILLEGYENGTIFIDTIIPPTTTIKYAGATPIVKATRLNKTEVLANSNDIADNIIPYLCDMDYRIVLLQLETGETITGYKSLSNLDKMLERDIKSKRYSENEYRNRLDAYFELSKLTKEEYSKLGDNLDEIYC